MTEPKANVKDMMDNAIFGAKADHAMRLMPSVIAEAEIVTRIRRAYYDAAIKEGFTPDQALALCIKPSLT